MQNANIRDINDLKLWLGNYYTFLSAYLQSQVNSTNATGDLVNTINTILAEFPQLQNFTNLTGQELVNNYTPLL